MNLLKKCSFFGHRDIDITNKLINDLKTILEDLIKNKGYSTFYFGGFGKFDFLCHQIISELKKEYSYIQRIFCLYDPRHKRVFKRPKWLNSENYEDFIYLNLSFDYWYKRIYFRNIEMINKSDFVVFYVINKNNSGANKALEYAIKKKKNFINIVEV